MLVMGGDLPVISDSHITGFTQNCYEVDLEMKVYHSLCAKTLILKHSEPRLILYWAFLKCCASSKVFVCFGTVFNQYQFV